MYPIRQKKWVTWLFFWKLKLETRWAVTANGSRHASTEIVSRETRDLFFFLLLFFFFFCTAGTKMNLMELPPNPPSTSFLQFPTFSRMGERARNVIARPVTRSSRQLDRLFSSLMNTFLDKSLASFSRIMSSIYVLCCVEVKRRKFTARRCIFCLEALGLSQEV